MLNTDQILLLVLIVLIGGTIVLVGIQFYLLLQELRKGMENINQILEEVQQTAVNITTSTEHLKHGAQEIQSVAKNIREGVSTPVVSGLAAFGLVKSIMGSFMSDAEEEEE